LPRTEISAALAEHPNAREIVWVQEEPANMGALFYVLPRLERLAQARGLQVRSVKRSMRALECSGPWPS
jgi:2-oxoglutarate dehydrogenase E1 component